MPDASSDDDALSINLGKIFVSLSRRGNRNVFDMETLILRGWTRYVPIKLTDVDEVALGFEYRQ